ncbi:hypothetical protein F5146DRAFT_1192509 [Armillaria mellea]|nr:hypothetical protein F5146DRAFT_1192509 [Armillaria mellea]
MITLYNLPTKTTPGTMMTWRTSTKSDGVSPFYTIPIIQDDATGAVVSDSIAIAAYLDKNYPSSGPVLIPAGTQVLQLVFASAVAEAFDPFRSFFAYNIMKKTNDATVSYFIRGAEREKLWANAKENLGKMNKWSEGGEGDFVMGNEPCFADTAISGFLQFTRVMLGEESEEWKEIASWNDGRWGKYLESFKPYEKLTSASGEGQCCRTQFGSNDKGDNERSYPSQTCAAGALPVSTLLVQTF